MVDFDNILNRLNKIKDNLVSVREDYIQIEKDYKDTYELILSIDEHLHLLNSIVQRIINESK